MSSLPDWHLIKISERRHWCEDLQALTKEIWGVYAVDLSSRTYCCEITPSHALYFITNDYVTIDDLTDDQNDRVNDLIVSAHDDSVVTYMHCRVVQQVMHNHPELTKKVDISDMDEEDRTNDNKVVDYIAENWGTGALMY